MTATGPTQILDPGTTGPEGFPDKNRITTQNDAKMQKEDEEQAVDAAKLRPEREAKFSDYYASISYFQGVYGQICSNYT